MRRREFLGVFGGVAAAWPLAARAQEKVRRIGVLVALAESDPEVRANVGTFQQTLQKLGWIEGRNALAHGLHLTTFCYGRRPGVVRA
jgi:putative ABC transport system substrate-binding protein